MASVGVFYPFFDAYSSYRVMGYIMTLSYKCIIYSGIPCFVLLCLVALSFKYISQAHSYN